jgi:6-phosphogluconolactonase (cycloisomerase 2 family)
MRRLVIGLVGALLLVSCGGGGYGGGGGGASQVTVPNVVGMTQSAATTAITGAGLMVGTVTMASSATVASGSVISQNPAAAAYVASGSAVNLTVSSGPAQVAVPNEVGTTTQAAVLTLTNAGLKIGTVTMTTSATVAPGHVISQNPAAATMVAPGSTVDLTVSVGPAPKYAYAANAGSGSISAYSINSSGALTALGPPVSVPGSVQLYEIKTDPSGKFLYAVDQTANKIYGFSINSNDGSLAAVTGSPYTTGTGPQSLAFDSTGFFVYVSNSVSDNISAYSLDQSTGALNQLGASPYKVLATGSNPAQIVSAGNYLYVTCQGSNSVDVFSITAVTGALTEGVAGSPFQTGAQGPYGISADASGKVMYVVNATSGAGSISAFTIDSSTGVLKPVAGNPLVIPVTSYISIDPQGKFLFVTEATGVAVYPIDTATGILGTVVTGSPFPTGTNPYSVVVDRTDQFVYVANDGSATVSEFTLNSATGMLNPMTPPSIAAGTSPDFIAID